MTDAGHAKRESREDWARRLRVQEFGSPIVPMSSASCWPNSGSRVRSDLVDKPVPYAVTPLGRMEILVDDLRKNTDRPVQDLLLSTCRIVIAYVWGEDMARAVCD